MKRLARGLVLSVVVASSSCGARSTLEVPDASAPPAGECLLDFDCVTDDRCHPLQCVARACVPLPKDTCDDGDPCTTDACVPATGACTSTPLAIDRDGDGVKGPAPGQSWRDPSACGHDCDDANAAAFPGNAEICDGLDNDCNGVVDDGAIYLPVPGLQPTLVSAPTSPLATGAGLARASTTAGYLASYTDQQSDGHTKVTVRRMGEDGAPLSSPQPVNLTLGDAEGGPLVWTGDRYGLVWSDRRTGDYEIWFSPLDAQGNKLGPDARVSFADGFSISPALGWDGSSFYVVWQDQRTDSFAIWGRRLDPLGAPLTDEILIADEDEAEAPDIAVSSSTLAVVYRTGGPSVGSIVFRTLQPGLTKASAPLVLAKQGAFSEAGVALQGDDLIATWVALGVQHRIQGAVLTSSGTKKVSPKELKLPGGETRAPRVIGLGDRALLVYGHVTGSTGFDVWTSTLDPSLAPIGAPQAMTAAPGDELPESIAFGSKGDVAAVLTGRVPIAGTSKFKPAAELAHLSCSGLVMGP